MLFRSGCNLSGESPERPGQGNFACSGRLTLPDVECILFEEKNGEIRYSDAAYTGVIV